MKGESPCGTELGGLASEPGTTQVAGKSCCFKGKAAQLRCEIIVLPGTALSPTFCHMSENGTRDSGGPLGSGRGDILAAKNAIEAEMFARALAAGAFANGSIRYCDLGHRW